MASTSTPVQLLTLGQLRTEVRERGVRATEAQVKYAIDAYDIEPAGRVGILRVWTPDAIPRLVSALRRIASNRGGAL